MSEPAPEYVPPKLHLPMHMRRINPMGYVHGQINWQGVKHPGYDLNDGPSGWADLDQELVAPGHGVVVSVSRASGWGTLLVGYLADKQRDPLTGNLIHIGFRFGHPNRVLVKEGERFVPGQVIATCGNGGNPDMSPHLHFDYFRRSRMEQIGADFVKKHGQKEADRVTMPHAYWDLKGVRDEFSKGSLYIDPAFYHPELRPYSPNF